MEQFAFIGENNAVASTLEKLASAIGLEFLNLTRECRLREMNEFRGARNVAGSTDGLESFELTQVHQGAPKSAAWQSEIHHKKANGGLGLKKAPAAIKC